eukprot:7422010-Lingulodinium_polyedra.AAC.1
MGAPGAAETSLAWQVARLEAQEASEQQALCTGLTLLVTFVFVAGCCCSRVAAWACARLGRRPQGGHEIRLPS